MVPELSRRGQLFIAEHYGVILKPFHQPQLSFYMDILTGIKWCWQQCLKKLSSTICTSLLFSLLLISTTLQAEAPIGDVIHYVNHQVDQTIYEENNYRYAVHGIVDQLNNELIKTRADKDELIFILAGQSNMAGYGDTAKLPAAFRRTPHNVKFYFNGYPAKMSRFARFGPEVSFAHILGRHFPNKTIKLIKFAVGGTSLFAWDPYWQLAEARLTRNASAGPLFKKLIQTITKHTRNRHDQLAGILWMQGETDARYPRAAHSYSRNLSLFVKELRTALDKPHLAFFMGQVDPPVKIFPYRDLVRKQQAESTRTIRNSRLILTDGLKKRNDDLHYNTAGQIALGERFAKAYLQSVHANR